MRANLMELDAKTYEAIKTWCAIGDQFASEKRYEESIVEYNKAWKLIPEPKNDWEASTWILGAIADATCLAGYITSAREALEYAMTCPGAIGNPFLHMRYGQVLYEIGDLDRATDELMRAYMGAGDDIFVSEDAKYLTFLRTCTKL